METILSLFRNTLFSITINLFNRLGNTLIFIFVIQDFGVDVGGVYNLALAYYFIGSRFAFWGLDHLLTREVAKDRSQAGRFISNFLLARGFIALITTIIFIFLVQLIDYESSAKLVISIMLLSVLPENINNLCWSVFAAFEELHLAGIGTLVNLITKLGLGFLLIKAGANIESIVSGILLGHILAMAVNLILVRYRYWSDWERPNLRFIGNQLKIAVPFFYIAAFNIMDNRLDNILLSFLNTAEAIGYYGAATAVIVALNMIPEGYRMAVLPVMARYQRSGSENLQKLYTYSFKFLLVLGIPISVASFLMADNLIYLIYRKSLPETIASLRIMSLILTLSFLNVLNNRLLVVYDRQRLTARFLTLTLILNIIANVLLLPRLGSIGASIGRVISVISLFILTHRAASHLIKHVNLRSYFWRPLVSAVIMGSAIWLVADWGIGIQTVVGSVIYILFLIVTGAISPRELRLFRQLFNHSFPKVQ